MNHNWEEVDGFWTCSGCGGNGGPTKHTNGIRRGPVPTPPGKSHLGLPNNCLEAKRVLMIMGGAQVDEEEW